MRKEKNELLMFLAGLAMLIVGLFILSQKVMVHTSWWGFGGFRLNGGLIMVPFIAGIIWLFATNSVGSKILTGLGFVFIIVSIIMSVDFYLMSMTLFDWIVLLILIFGGVGLLAGVLFGNKNPGYDYPSTKASDIESRAKSIEEELEELKTKD